MNKKVKYSIIHFLGSGDVGGKERALYNLFLAFKDQPDYQLAIATFNIDSHYVRRIRELGFQAIDLKTNSFFDLIPKPGLAKILTEYKIYHHHDSTPRLILLSLFCRKKNKLVQTRRGGLEYVDRQSFKKKLKIWIRSFLYNKYFLGFSGISRVSILSLEKDYRIVNKKKLLTRNYFDHKRINFNRQREAVNLELNLSNNDFVIGYFGHLVKLKRIDLLIRAFSKLKISEKKLLIIGRGPERDELARIIDKLNLKEKVILLEEKKEIFDYYQVLKCFVLPSNSREGWSNSAAEALFLGIPTIIMSDNFGSQDFIIDNFTGFIANNELDLTNTLQKVHDDFDYAKSIASNGSDFMVKNYSLSNSINDYIELYKEVLNE
ncbi:MAG: glycosyltransferase [Ignavibacteriaceae bacterium]|nr:glycosyltransferase [Ignavibacteriaceae bacterium]